MIDTYGNKYSRKSKHEANEDKTKKKGEQSEKEKDEKKKSLPTPVMNRKYQSILSQSNSTLMDGSTQEGDEDSTFVSAKEKRRRKKQAQQVHIFFYIKYMMHMSIHGETTYIYTYIYIYRFRYIDRYFSLENRHMCNGVGCHSSVHLYI